jgi:3-hydroxyisobutyrate dehydrogenase
MHARIGVVGLGTMGEGMATNLVNSGYQVAVRDTRQEVVERLVTVGAEAPGSNFALAQGVESLFVVVFDDQQVLDVCLGSERDPGVIAGLPEQSVLVVHSTVRRSTLRLIANAAQLKGIEVLDAAMTGGGQQAANSGTLTFYVGGESVALARVRPALEAMASDVIHVGALGSGSVVKVISNFLAIANTNLVREALGLGRALGLDDGDLLEMINSGEVGSSWVSGNWEAIRSQEVNHKFANGVADLARKDLAAASNLAVEVDVSLPILRFLTEEITPRLKSLSDVDENPGVPSPRPESTGLQG